VFFGNCERYSRTFENLKQIGFIGLNLIDALQRFANSLFSAQTIQLGHRLLCRVAVCYYAGANMVLYSNTLRL
jgi:hypothetical protein